MNKQQLFENIQKKKSFLCVGLVSIMLVLTYGKSRKKAGSSPICGVIGTVPFQVLMVISTVLSAIGALIPLS